MAIFHTIPAGDLQLDGDGQFVWVDGVTYTRQRLAARFRFFLGEYFLDQRQGIPYYRDVFVKHPDLNVIRSLFRKTILTTPGMSIDTFELEYDESNRRLLFDFVAIHESGEAITVTPDDDSFIVAL